MKELKKQNVNLIIYFSDATSNKLEELKAENYNLKQENINLRTKLNNLGGNQESKYIEKRVFFIIN